MSGIGQAPIGAPILRPYQVKAVEAAMRELAIRRSTMLVMATGTGKTPTVSEVIRRYTMRGLRTLVLAHREEIIEQNHAKLATFGVHAGIEQASRRGGLESCIVASVATLRGARLARFDRDAFDLIVPDECHHSPATSWKAIIDHFATAKVLGLTATPKRADGKPLGDVFETVAYRYEIRQAIAEQYLVPIMARRIVIDSVDLSAIKTRAGDLAQDQLAAQMDTQAAIWGVVMPTIENVGDRTTIVFGVDLNHVHAMTAAFNQARPGSARAVWGDMPRDAREQVLADYACGRFQYLINVDIGTEGFDCVDEHTEILTAAGWKGIGQVAVGEMMYALDRETEQLDLVPIERYVERPLSADERMVSIRSQHVDIRTSEHHEFHIKYRDPKTGGKLSKNWLTLDGDELVERRSAYGLPIAAPPAVAPVGIDLTDDEIRFVAWFMTDGGFVDHGRTVSIAQSKHYHDEIRALLRRLGLHFRERVRIKTDGYAAKRALPLHEFTIPKGTHHGSMKRAGWHKYGAYLSKDVSPLLHGMSRPQFDVFWAELMKGDGSAQGKKAGWLWCDRKTQVDAYSHMAVARGFSCSFAEEITKTSKTVYRISVRDAQWLTSEPSDKRSARAKFDDVTAGERVWCVTNRLSTIVARRNGKIVIIGNCPRISCVAIARPTKSWAAYVQRVGRMTRLLGTTMAESVANGKRDGLLLDFTGRAGEHRLIGPLDCLIGENDTPISDAEDEEAGRLLSVAQLPLGEVLVKARSAAIKRQAELATEALVRYHAEHIDPFIGSPPPSDAGVDLFAGREFRPPTDKQLKILKKLGVALTQLPRMFSMGAASGLIARLQARKADGRATLKQAKAITAAAKACELTIDTSSISYDRGVQLFQKLRLSNYHARAIQNEPEFVEARRSRERGAA